VAAVVDRVETVEPKAALRREEAMKRVKVERLNVGPASARSGRPSDGTKAATGSSLVLLCLGKVNRGGRRRGSAQDDKYEASSGTGGRRVIVAVAISVAITGHAMVSVTIAIAVMVAVPAAASRRRSSRATIRAIRGRAGQRFRTRAAAAVEPDAVAVVSQVG